MRQPTFWISNGSAQTRSFNARTACVKIASCESEWTVNSPAFSGVNSTATGFPSGRLREMPKSPKITCSVHAFDSRRMNVNRTGRPCHSLMRLPGMLAPRTACHEPIRGNGGDNAVCVGGQGAYGDERVHVCRTVPRRGPRTGEELATRPEKYGRREREFQPSPAWKIECLFKGGYQVPCHREYRDGNSECCGDQESSLCICEVGIPRGLLGIRHSSGVVIRGRRQHGVVPRVLHDPLELVGGRGG